MALLLIPQIHRTTHQIGLYIERSGLGLNQGEAHIMAHLASAGDSTVGQLHQAFAHKRSTLTSFLDRLAERRLIRREVRSEDRRSFVISLTPAGKLVARKIHRHLETLEKAALRGAKPGKTKAFADVIGALEAAATRL
ncbi:MAG TPA: MarR family transcriptional regulator [Bryobacteraceae bacterium]|nr:MarR family transcriptional regulator [Bryobacteraceae bacterium]